MSARIRVSVTIDAPPAVVWHDVRDIASHVEWMHDAVAIRFLGDVHSGVGAAFDCDTKVGPFSLTDRMEITEWDDGRSIGVRHAGLVTGSGRFTLEPAGADRTLFTWDERLRFPWWLGGAVGAVAGGLVLSVVWRRNLKALAARFPSDGGQGRPSRSTARCSASPSSTNRVPSYQPDSSAS